MTILRNIGAGIAYIGAALCIPGLLIANVGIWLNERRS